MRKDLQKYLIPPFIYILSVFLLIFYSNIILALIWLTSMLLCLVGVVRLLIKKMDFSSKFLPLILLLIPVYDTVFGLNNTLNEAIKGRIVLSAIDKSFATTKAIIVREKEDELTGEFDFSVAGFGELEMAQVRVANDSTLVFTLLKRDYSEKLILHRKTQTLRNEKTNTTYRILTNQLLK